MAEGRKIITLSPIITRSGFVGRESGVKHYCCGVLNTVLVDAELNSVAAMANDHLANSSMELVCEEHG